jgi:hypothetical protein
VSPSGARNDLDDQQGLIGQQRIGVLRQVFRHDSHIRDAPIAGARQIKIARPRR